MKYKFKQLNAKLKIELINGNYLVVFLSITIFNTQLKETINDTKSILLIYLIYIHWENKIITEKEREYGMKQIKRKWGKD